MGSAMTTEDILHALEAEGRIRSERLREMILVEAGTEALAEYDLKLKEIRLGIEHAFSGVKTGRK
jgi:hypothetical protein